MKYLLKTYSKGDFILVNPEIDWSIGNKLVIRNKNSKNIELVLNHTQFEELINLDTRTVIKS